MFVLISIKLNCDYNHTKYLLPLVHNKNILAQIAKQYEYNHPCYLRLFFPLWLVHMLERLLLRESLVRCIALPYFRFYLLVSVRVPQSFNNNHRWILFSHLLEMGEFLFVDQAFIIVIVNNISW